MKTNFTLKKMVLILITFLYVILVLTACVPSKASKYIGIAMPTSDLKRWRIASENMKTQLESKGYKVDLQYADNDIPTQINQIQDMITAGVQVLVIAAIDDSYLDDVLMEAKAKGITIIAYDRLLPETEAIDYYISFNHENVCTFQCEYIVKALGLDRGERGPFTLEIFANGNNYNFARAIGINTVDVLVPYIESGILIVKSGDGIVETDWENYSDIYTLGADGAQERMENLLTTYYIDENIDVVLSPHDWCTQGIITALDAAGYGTADKPFPILTGDGCTIDSIKSILADKQSMSVFWYSKNKVARVVIMIEQIFAGEDIETNDSFDNGEIEVPAFLCDTRVVDITNYKEILIDSGYYTEDKLR